MIEARVSHLAYAPEIAQAMLQRQQAAAIIAARTRIVEGAVTMVHMALEQLAEKGVVQLDEERKAAMVSNLLVVLCGERGTQPDRQHRHAVQRLSATSRWLRKKPIRCASAATSWTPCNAGRRTSCAA